MNGRNLAAVAATLLLLGLPVADFIRDGQVADSLVGGLVIVAFGGGGLAADKAIKARIRKWAEGGEDAA